MAYYFVFPLAWRFFVSFETPGGEGIAADPARGPGRRVSVAGDEADLRLRPVLPAAGGADADGPGRPDHLEQLRHNRKFAIVGVFVVAAVITPPDVISQVGLGVPILALYEISIIAVRIVERKRAEAEAAEAAAEDGSGGHRPRPRPLNRLRSPSLRLLPSSRCDVTCST